jgi:exodeoxyribonuclease V beta subunit
VSDFDPALPAVEPVSDERNAFTFPQGARAGRCLHAIFETLDFTRADQWPAVVTEKLTHYGFAADWAEVVTAWVPRVLHTPLDADGRVTLAGVDRGRRLTELEFLYPFEALDATVVKDLLHRHWPAQAATLEQLDFRLLAGFMRGFIDLVFAAGGRFYLVDYKSNWLGARLADYQGEALATAMIAGGYPLQYLIYTLALHRYLRQRLPGYDYARDFAGVRYLFLRGMEPALGAGGGVFADRPPPPLIAALDRYLAGG